MRIDIVTVFPEMVRDALAHSIVKRAIDSGIVSINVVNLREFTRDRHKTTDDTPYGGGGGMVMKIEPIARALIHLTCAASETNSDSETATGLEFVKSEFDRLVGFPARCRQAGVRVALTDPRGMRFDQQTARKWANDDHLILLCGHYEGVDDRVRQRLVTDEVSIGDYVLTGGELPALVIVDAVTRLQAGALGDVAATDKDTFSEDLLEYPHYTRPYAFVGWKTPDILLCGHHAEIQRWRRWHQLHDTHNRRPDLYQKLALSASELKLFTGPEPTAPVDDRQDRQNSKIKKHEDTDGTGI